MFKVIVKNEQEKQELLQASRLLHYKRHINLRHPGLNTMAHLYLHPEDIEVIPDNPETAEVQSINAFSFFSIDNKVGIPAIANKDGTWYRKGQSGYIRKTANIDGKETYLLSSLSTGPIQSFEKDVIPFAPVEDWDIIVINKPCIKIQNSGISGHFCK